MSTVKSPQASSNMSLPAIVPSTSQVIATSGAHQESAAVGSPLIRVCCSADCWIAIGAAPVADKTTSIFLPSGVVEYFGCLSTDKVSVLQDTAGGNLSITPAAVTAT